MNSKILLALFAASLCARSASVVMVTWAGTNGVSATVSWSDSNNWDQITTTTHVSPANNAANFTGQTAMPAAGIITVIVDGAYGTPGTGLAQSYGAFFGQTNGYHRVVIEPGITWALQASAATPGVGLSVGPQPTNNNSITNVNVPAVQYTNYTTITGSGGTLFEDGVGVRVEGGVTAPGNHYSILDMSGLGTFILTNNQQGASQNISSNSFLLVSGVSNSQGVVYLALTNIITLINNFQVGYLGLSSNTLPIGVYLGQSNYIFTGASNNNLVIGAAGCTSGFMQFNPQSLGGLGKPSVYFNGSGGSQNVTICTANGGVVPGYAICDLTGGNVTWSANVMSIGVSGTGNASASGVLSFDGGSVTANSVTVGAQPNSGGAAGAGTINIGANATFQANNGIVLGSATGAVTPGTMGTINVSGGTVIANSIVTGGGSGAVNMTNGNWNVALGSTGTTNIIANTFTASGATNIINVTSITGVLGPTPRFHLIVANLSGAATLGLGPLPVSPDPAQPYKGYLDTTTTPGMVDLVLTNGPFDRRTNLVTNPGFEVDPQGENSVLYGWNIYSGSSGNVLNESSAILGNDGNNYLKVYSALNSTVNYNGVYQDNISGPGAVYTADGWAYTSASDTLAGQNAAWIEITFRDATANILALYRSAIINTNAIATGAFPKNAWIDLAVTNQYDPTTFLITNHVTSLVAPAGTSFVRYQVLYNGDAANSRGSVYFDDLNLTQTGGGPYGNWNIVWSDEFNSTSLSNIWSYDTGGGGWGNNELEYYSSSSQNVHLTNGLLHITGLIQSQGGENYTSGRIKTLGKYYFKYGRIAFRAKVPGGVGLWPGLWMMPEDSVYGGWAASGEIDVMESTGRAPSNVIGTIHYGGPWPDVAQSGGPSYNFIPGASLTNFNTYVLEWSSNAFNWYINGWLYETQTNWWSSSNTNHTQLNPYPAPFNQPFYILMNLAIGGAYGGPTVDNSAFPADLQLDYVRLYNVTAPLQLSAGASNGNFKLTWPSNIVCHLESTTNLSGANWTNVPGAATPYSVTVHGAAYYRLESP